MAVFVFALAGRTCGASEALECDAGVVEVFAVSAGHFGTKIWVGPALRVFGDVDNVSCKNCFPYLLANFCRKSE